MEIGIFEKVALALKVIMTTKVKVLAAPSQYEPNIVYSNRKSAPQWIILCGRKRRWCVIVYQACRGRVVAGTLGVMQKAEKRRGVNDAHNKNQEVFLLSLVERGCGGVGEKERRRSSFSFTDVRTE